MLSERIKSSTKEQHQELEKHVVYQLKAIQNNQDYAEVLKYFYSYFQALEQLMEKQLPASLTEYYSVRRNANHIAKDIELLGENVNVLPTPYLPNITNANEAIGALYVLEGSIMGGPYIVKMLQKLGVDTGFTFFNGYGEESPKKWAEFTAIINEEVQSDDSIQEAITAAVNTFQNFTNTFNQTASA